MEAKHKAYLEELAAKVDAKLLEYVQVTPETRRQAQVVEAMRYSLAASGSVRCWCWNSAGFLAARRSRQWRRRVPLKWCTPFP